MYMSEETKLVHAVVTTQYSKQDVTDIIDHITQCVVTVISAVAKLDERKTVIDSTLR